MATICSNLSTEFTPAAGDFIAQVSGGSAALMRKNSSGAAFTLVGNIAGQAVIVSNPISGAVYRFDGFSGSPVVQADQ